MLVTGRTVSGGTASDLKRTIVRLRRFTQRHYTKNPQLVQTPVCDSYRFDAPEYT